MVHKGRSIWQQQFDLLSAELAGRRFVVIADPWLAASTVTLLRDVGAEVISAQSTASDPKPVLGLPTPEELGGVVDADIFLVPTRGIDYALRLAKPFFEFGFTSYGTHAFFDAPMLGFGGAVNLLSGVVSNMSFFSETGKAVAFNLKKIADSYQVDPLVGRQDDRS